MQLESQKISYERKLNEAYMEIERLEKCVNKLRSLQSIADENYDEDDDIFEIEDD